MQLQLAVAKSLHAATLAVLLQLAVAKSLHVATLVVQLLAVAAKSLLLAVATTAVTAVAEAKSDLADFFRSSSRSVATAAATQ
ncbi:MAG: hypothetical protein Aurels2KO_15370 [Aureliella sp.]